MNFDVLLNISGGLDSTFCLWQQLTEHPKEKILLHHIRLHSKKENRLDLEWKAVANILAWLEKQPYDNWEYHETSFDYGTLPDVTVRDIKVVAFFTGIILRTPSFGIIKRLIVPRHLGEVVEAKDEPIKAYRILSVLLALEAPKVRLVFPIEHLTRKDMVEKLPQELLECCHSCRRPIKGQPCGNCNTCRDYIQQGLKPL